MLSKQTPIDSGFGPQSTAIETLGSPDQEGKVAIVTGGASGIMLEMTANTATERRAIETITASY